MAITIFLYYDSIVMWKIKQIIFTLLKKKNI